MIRVELKEAIKQDGERIRDIYFEPLLFSQLPKLRDNPSYCSDDRLLLACGRIQPSPGLGSLGSFFRGRLSPPEEFEPHTLERQKSS